MKMKFLLAAAVALPLLAGCAELTTATKTVCDDIANLPSSVTAVLDGQAPHSALGVVWADAKSGCANGAPTVGVSTKWTSMVWDMVKVLAPTVVPWVIGLL